MIQPHNSIIKGYFNFVQDWQKFKQQQQQQQQQNKQEDELGLQQQNDEQGLQQENDQQELDGQELQQQHKQEQQFKDGQQLRGQEQPPEEVVTNMAPSPAMSSSDNPTPPPHLAKVTCDLLYIAPQLSQIWSCIH